ncbi:Ankyrin repeat domain-containing protein 50 [Schistosoma japonicum]|nr:Ankyrin repeat domain-containing protein 50 [Schistosoma japonicum]
MSSRQSTNTNEDKIKLLNACRHGDLDYLGRFIVDGGNLQHMIDNQTGQTPLHCCIKCTEEDKDDDEEEGSKNEKKEDTKNTNENVTVNVFRRSQLDRLKCTRVIIKSNPEFLTSYDYNGYTPLHLAVIHGDLDFIKVLNEFNNVDMKIKTKGKSLMMSTASSSTTMNRNEPNDINNIGRTVIHLCVIYSQLNILNYLLTNNNNLMKDIINEYDDQGATALHYSVQVNPEQIDELFELLINIGEANLNAPDTHGRTPLIWAATVGSTHAVEVLLKLGANLNHKDSHGLTALHCAASRGNVQTIQIILNWISIANKDDESKIALFRDVNDNDGCSPLFYSVTTGHIHVTECLIQAGTNVNHTDYKGRTVCHCLARLNSLSNGIKFENLIKAQLNCLMKAGLDPWKANNTGLTALHEACLLRNVCFVKQLATLPGFSKIINATESQGHTSLHLVVAASWSTEPSGLRLCQFLLEHEADINAITHLPNNENVTPLNLAYLNETNDEKSKESLINLLKQYGGRTYQELINEGKVHTDLITSNYDHDNVHIDSKNEDKNPNTLSITENELNQVNKIKTSNECVQTSSKERPHMIDTATEPMENLNSSLTLKDSSVQTCLDRRRRRNKVSKHSLTSLSSEQLLHENTNILPNKYDLTNKSMHKSHENTTNEKFSSLTINDQIKLNNFNNNHNETNTKQFIVHVPTSSNMKLRNNNNNNNQLNEINVENRNITNISQKQQLHHHYNSSSSTLNNKILPNLKYPSYSPIYLERELPLVLKRYLDKENNQYSPLIRRSRMPKPTISPYLQPVVPGLSLIKQKSLLCNQVNQSTRKKSHSANSHYTNYSNLSNPQSNSTHVTNSKLDNAQQLNCSHLDVTMPKSHYSTTDNRKSIKNIKQSQIRSKSSKNSHSNLNVNNELKQTIVDNEFYEYFNQLLKQTNSITQIKNKHNQSINQLNDQHSAMGGELTPINKHRTELNIDHKM